jgi:hypothetical protein
MEWGTEGGIDTGVAGNKFLMHGERAKSLDVFEVAMGTASPVTRWREANPGLVETEGDVVRLMREAERCLRLEFLKRRWLLRGRGRAFC